jgi:hypothetical protein
MKMNCTYMSQITSQVNTVRSMTIRSFRNKYYAHLAYKMMIAREKKHLT